MNHFLTAIFQRYTLVDGRAARAEFNYFFLFQFLSVLAALLVELLLLLVLGIPTFLSTIVSLGLFIPGVTVSVRRLHDVSKSGWWLLVWFIPLINLVFWIWLAFADSIPGSNLYGPNPKGIETNPSLP